MERISGKENVSLEREGWLVKWGRGQKRLTEKGTLSKTPGRQGCAHEEIWGNRVQI